MLIACALGIPTAIILLMWLSDVRQERRRAKNMQEYIELMRKWREIQDRK